MHKVNKINAAQVIISCAHSLNSVEFAVVEGTNGRHYLRTVDYNRGARSCFVTLAPEQFEHALEIAEAFPRSDPDRVWALAKLADKVRAERFL